MHALRKLRLLVHLSLRNIWAHRLKSAVVGSLMAFGTFLVVLGGSFLESVQHGMERSITASLAGNIQVYSAAAKDELALFGGMAMGDQEVGEVPRFGPVREALAALPEVAAVVPMGLTMATVALPGALESTLADLRVAIYAKDAQLMDRLAGQTRQIAAQMLVDLQNRAVLSTDVTGIEAQRVILAQATGDALWQPFTSAPLTVLEFLDTRLAPIADDGRTAYMRVLGTDLDAFVEHFDRFVLVSGALVPGGKPGMLLSRRYYEEFLKNPVARDLDAIHRAVVTDRRPIARDPKLQTLVRRLPAQYERVTYDLSVSGAEHLVNDLGKELGVATGTLPELMQAFLKVDDGNIAARYAFFYEHIAPLIRLHAVEVGHNLTLRSFTKSGYLKSINVPVYGVFDFKGLESSDLAGAQNLVDLITFRELYGAMTEKQRAELREVKARIGARDVSRDDAEAALFGDDASTATVAPTATPQHFDEFAGGALDDIRAAARGGAGDRSFTSLDIDNGLVRSVAIMLRPGVNVETGLAAVRSAIDAKGLGLRAVDWQQAAGIVGQLIWVIRGVLYVAIAIVFMVALFIIHNSMVIATMDRVSELGTMRAIGAQRLFIVAMFITETVVLGILAGGVGMGLAAALVTFLGHVGIPAGGIDILVFLFSGPRLFPAVTAVQLVTGVVAILAVSLLSTLYPAKLPNSVQPVVAKQRKE